MISYNFKLFYVLLESNIGSYSTRYTLIVPHISEWWPEGSLIRPKHVARIKY